MRKGIYQRSECKRDRIVRVSEGLRIKHEKKRSPTVHFLEICITVGS